MKYDIIASDARSGSVTVRFLTDTRKILSELKIPVPIENGSYSLVKLKDLIEQVAKLGLSPQTSPLAIEARWHSIQEAKNFADVQMIINKGAAAADEHFSKAEQRQFIESILEEYGLIKSSNLKVTVL